MFRNATSSSIRLVKSPLGLTNRNVLLVQSRNMGFFNNIKTAINNKTEEKTKERNQDAFLKTQETLIALPQYRIKEYYEGLKSAIDEANTLSGKISAAVQKDQMTKIKISFGVFDALTPVERVSDNTRIINMAVKQRIISVTGVTAADINIELRKFQEMQTLHGWLRKRVSKGLKLPGSQQELMEMMITDPPEITEAMKSQQKSQQRRRFR